MRVFSVGVRVRQGCVLLPWLFSIYMDGFMCEVEARVGDLGASPRGCGR